MKNIKKGFTLVEVMVTITIFSIMMVSVMSVYLVSTNVTYKADLNRFMQENIKNIMTNVGENVLNYGVEEDVGKTNSITVGDKKYYLAEYDRVNGYIAVNDISTCDTIQKQCFLVQKDSSISEPIPITNDLVSVKKMDFYITGHSVKRLTIAVTLAIAPNVGVASGLIKNTRLVTQMSFTQRKTSNS